MANLDLISVRAKLMRAQIHRQAINDEIKTWHDRYPYSLITKANPERTRYSLIIRINETPPFDKIALMLGDFLNNLRSALDHLIYAIACLECGSLTPKFAGKLQFPITDGRCDFDDAVKDRHLLGDISAPIVAEIERRQPYNRPHPILGRPLGLLASFNNADKHRLLSVVHGAVFSGEIGFASESGLPLPSDWDKIVHHGEIKDGTEIFAFFGKTPMPPDVKFDKHVITIVMTVRETKRHASSPADPERPIELPYLLDVLHEEVRGAIYYIDGHIN